MAERRHVGAAHLARRTGLSSRWFTGRASQGKIPGAYQPSGEGGAWRFDEELFWRWWDGRAAHGGRVGEGAGWQPSIGAGRPGGDVSSVKAVTSASPLRQALKQLRNSV